MATNPFKKIAKWAAWFFAACVVILLVTEVFLRIHESFFMNKEEISMRRYRSTVIQNIQRQWLNPTPTDPYLPPFLVYSDEGYNDEGRLKRIFDTTRAKPNVDATSWDFVRGPMHASQATYRIHTNSLGFRGAERTVSKPEGTKRIIVLGAYHAFGLGVNDDQTFSAQLERELNRLGAGKKYEVWNGGRQCDTAIVALARLKHEIFSYSPDVLILDYGYVDPLVWADDLMISAAHFPDGPVYTGIKAAWKSMLPLLFKTRVFNAFIDSIVKRSYKHNAGSFTGAMQAIISLAAEKKVPVILLRQMPGEIKDDVYWNLTKPGVRFVPVREVLTKTPLSNDVLTECRSPRFWMREAPPALLKAENPLCYFLDPLQLNAAGHKVLGQSLARTILEGH